VLTRASTKNKKEQERTIDQHIKTKRTKEKRKEKERPNKIKGVVKKRST